MTIEYDGAQLRRYVLGTSTTHEREAIERDYFARADVLDQVTAAEEELIDDYLSARLSQTDREQFERSYLASPHHRTRVAVLRAIRGAASSRPVTQVENQPAPVAAPIWSARRTASWWAVAASLVMLVGAGVWLLRPRSAADIVADHRAAAPEAQDTAPQTATPPPAATPSSGRSPDPSRGTAVPTPSSQPVVLAVTISPVLVRGADEHPTITIARGTDIVRLQLRGQAGERLTRGRSLIRTVGGREVWRGRVTPVSDSRPELARVDVPASALRPDDYIIELFETSAAGREVERHKYFLRVLSP